MALTTDQILSAIDNMTIYEKDYETIKKILAYGDASFFTKIVEEVINGNILWSDFEPILSNTKYPELLREQLKNQSELDKYLTKLAAFRNKSETEFENIAVVKDTNFYSDEYKNTRDNIIRELTKLDENDSVIVKAYKTRLYNAIKNGEYLKENKMPINDDGTFIETVNEGDTKKEIVYEVIDPDDIFMFIQDYIVPIDMDYQVLDDFDRAYMFEHNLTEKTMKKIKGASALFRKKEEDAKAGNDGT